MGHGLKPLRIRLSLQRSERLGGGIAELDLMRGEAVQAISVAAVAARAEIALLRDLCAVLACACLWLPLTSEH